MPLILALGGRGRHIAMSGGQPGLHSDFQDSQGYIVTCNFKIIIIIIINEEKPFP